MLRRNSIRADRYCSAVIAVRSRGGRSGAKSSGHQAGKVRCQEVGSICGTSENDRPYAFLFAQGVRVDPQDNIWIVDRASRMVVKFDQTGKVLLTLGRRLEAVGEHAAAFA